MTPQLERQIRVSRMLSMGFVFTICPMVWMMTSWISVFIGVRAMVIISESTEPMSGRVMAWWCIVVGSLQNLVSLLVMFGHYLNFIEWGVNGLS